MCCAASLAHDTHCEITINQGMLKGSLSRSKKDFCAYTGIPYGEPPLGNLRFRAPRPLKSWEGVLDATKEGNICWQPASFDKYLGDEDCLFINVYTPNLKSSVERILPVMFWIPPGEFYTENNYRSSYEPDLFVDKDILLVTFNYRVGAFGFLSTQDDEAPGNYGMKDQILALHWVRDNIKAFGGDPSRVTIAGISSGAASVHFLLLSPLAKDIMDSTIPRLYSCC
ncbi:Venom carboxylesterase-6 [Blattella germanica]|nr:Venom carboxylesterase-6 [Blattella germanica]